MKKSEAVGRLIDWFQEKQDVVYSPYQMEELLEFLEIDLGMYPPINDYTMVQDINIDARRIDEFSVPVFEWEED